MAAGVRNAGVFGHMPDGQPVERYELDNGRGLRGDVLTLGGVMWRLRTPDRAGQSSDILLAPAELPAMLASSSPYMGALIGRFGNRIKDGRFTLGGKAYQLAINNAPNSLHGGNIGYDKRVWTAEPITSADGVALKLSLVDRDGTENYPGTVRVSVV
ncbi:MAG: galactose-1-epimerase, partial [Burkholderiales bacterium]|nr:galactose-1-epimerase [Phycisphaerae bacterium]